MRRPVDSSRLTVLVTTLALLATSFSLAVARTADQSQKSGSESQVLSNLPLAAQAQISATLGREDASYRTTPAAQGFQAGNAHQNLKTLFSSQGVELLSGDAKWAMSLQGFGYGDALHALAAAVPEAKSNRIEYRRASITEWYVNGPMGLEQGFTVNRAPARIPGQPLTLAVALAGNLTAVLDESRTELRLRDSRGRTELQYSGLTAYDANQKPLRAWLKLHDNRLLILVADSAAKYPIVVDPFVQVATLAANDNGNSLGTPVAISGDTVVVGAPLANNQQGAAYVFVRPSTGWANMTQTAVLTASDAPTKFGSSVAISGATIVVGAPGTQQSSPGNAYVFVQPTAGWTSTTQTAELSMSNPQIANFGTSVATNGSTVVVGAPRLDSVFVYEKPLAGWRNLTEKAQLSNGNIEEGVSVAISGDGKTIVAGDPGCCIEGNPNPGEADIFIKPATGWTSVNTPTAILTGSDETANDFFGWSVGISGSTIVVGSPQAAGGIGSVYVFVEPADGWVSATQTAELRAPGAIGDVAEFGRAVAIQYNTLAVGALTFSQPAVYLYYKPASGWSDTTRAHTTTGKNIGASVAINGKTLVCGTSSNAVLVYRAR